MDPGFNSDNFEEGRLPLPGGVREDGQEVIEENIYTDEIIKNKSIEFYKYAMEKIAELKFVFGEALENYRIFNKSPYLTYLYALSLIHI